MLCDISSSHLTERAAAPLASVVHETAGVVVGATGVAVTHEPVRWNRCLERGSGIIISIGSGTRARAGAQGGHFPDQGHGPVGAVTGAGCQVTGGAVGAAVLHVLTAHGLMGKHEHSADRDTTHVNHVLWTSIYVCV